MHKSNQSLLLQVNTSEFKNGDWVEVSWSGVEDPAMDDLVALFAPAGLPHLLCLNAVAPTFHDEIQEHCSVCEQAVLA